MDLSTQYVLPSIITLLAVIDANHIWNHRVAWSVKCQPLRFKNSFLRKIYYESLNSFVVEPGTSFFSRGARSVKSVPVRCYYFLHHSTFFPRNSTTEWQHYCSTDKIWLTPSWLPSDETMHMMIDWFPDLFIYAEP